MDSMMQLARSGVVNLYELVLAFSAPIAFSAAPLYIECRSRVT